MLTKYIKVKVGEFEKDGKMVGKYITAGRVLLINGKEMFLLDKTFNPAGVPGEKDSIILSLFDAGEKRDTPAEAKAGIAKLQATIDDEIPF